MPTTAGMFGEQPPEGWAPPVYEPWSFDDVFVFRCERISFGPVSKPGFLLWEFHESFRVPDSCASPDYVNRFLATHWFDDAAFVELAAQNGMPSILGTFDLAKGQAGGVQTWDWTWSADGQPASSLLFMDNPPDVPVKFRSPIRIFWFEGTGVSYMDVELVHAANQVSNPTAAGTFAPPMFYARGSNPAYAGIGVPSDAASFTATIHRFSDLLCAEPLP